MKIDKMNKTTLLFLFLIPFGISSIAQTDANWVSDNTHSNFGFKVKHNGISYAVGEFRSFDLSITTNGIGFLNSEIELTIDAASINTANDSRDGHLRSADFFDTEKYPNITFKSKKITEKGENMYILTGDFTMHGVSKEIEVQMKHNGTIQSRGKDLAGLYFTTTVNRIDYGVGKEGSSLANEVELHADIEILKEE